MKRASERFRNSLVSELNVTPLIDLAFTLLIIFMIATPLIEQRMQVHLPNKDSDAPSDIRPDSVIDVTVDSNGRLFVNRQLVGDTQFRQILSSVKKRDPYMAVLLRIDSNVRYQQFVNVFDVLKDLDVQFDIVTVPQG